MREIAHKAVKEITTFRLRGQTVLIDTELAAFYGVPTKVLNSAVRRIIDRFPEDFMFRLTSEETRLLKQDQGEAIPSIRRLRRNPYAFTEQGIHAISYFLKSPRAIKISVELIKSFHSMRGTADRERDLFELLEQVKRRQDQESKRLWEATRSVHRLEEFREEVSNRIARGDDSWISDHSRERLDKIRYELDRIERRAMGHRELFYLLMMLFGALLMALIFFPR